MYARVCVCVRACMCVCVRACMCVRNHHHPVDTVFDKYLYMLYVVVDKNVSHSRIRLKRCPKRYHRAVFLWYLAIILNNVMALFAILFCDIDELKRSKEAGGVRM